MHKCSSAHLLWLARYRLLITFCGNRMMHKRLGTQTVGKALSSVKPFAFSQPYFFYWFLIIFSHQESFLATTTGWAAWALQQMAWLLPLAPGTASSRFGTKDSRGERKNSGSMAHGNRIISQAQQKHPLVTLTSLYTQVAYRGLLEWKGKEGEHTHWLFSLTLSKPKFLQAWRPIKHISYISGLSSTPQTLHLPPNTTTHIWYPALGGPLIQHLCPRPSI